MNLKTALGDDQELIEVYQEADEEPKRIKRQLIAQGYETTRPQAAIVADQMVNWMERVLVIYSPSLAKRAKQGLQGRLARAQQKLAALTPPRGRGKRQYDDLQALQAAAEAILQQHRVSDLLELDYERQVTQRQLRQYKDRPARTEETIRYQLQLARDEQAIQDQSRTFGWRLYVTNVPAAQCRSVPRQPKAIDQTSHHGTLVGCFQGDHFVLCALAWANRRSSHTVDPVTEPYSLFAGVTNYHLHRPGG